MKVIFFGSSDYCLPIVETLNKNFNLVSIITKKGQTVEKYAQSHNIKAYTPTNKEELLQLKSDISGLKPDLAIVADYGLLIPKEIFSIPCYQTLNIHFSKLPLFRGPSPVQYTILMDEKSAWITVIIMDGEMDTGDIIWQKPFDYSQGKEGQGETTGSLYNKLFNIASASLPDVISQYVKNELKPQKQDHSQATYTKHLTRQDGYIPSELLGMAIEGNQPTNDQLSKWSIFHNLLSQSPTTNQKLASTIERFIRALSPWPGVWTEIEMKQSNNDTMTQKRRLKILKAHLEPLASQGQPLRGYRLVLDQVQLEGKKPVSWKQFLDGYPHFSF